MTRWPGIALRELIDYHAHDDAWMPDVLAGPSVGALLGHLFP
jgi:hypothetical protein